MKKFYKLSILLVMICVMSFFMTGCKVKENATSMDKNEINSPSENNPKDPDSSQGDELPDCEEGSEKICEHDWEQWIISKDGDDYIQFYRCLYNPLHIKFEIIEKVPEIPEEPEIPVIPDPETPEPEIPDPEIPVTPEIPEEPETPVIPDPETPVTPETPDPEIPVDPETPDPETPETPEPETPVAPETPEPEPETPNDNDKTILLPENLINTDWQDEYGNTFSFKNDFIFYFGELTGEWQIEGNVIKLSPYTTEVENFTLNFDSESNTLTGKVISTDCKFSLKVIY